MPTAKISNADRIALLRQQSQALTASGASARNRAVQLARDLDAIDARRDLVPEIKKTMKADARQKAHDDASRNALDHGLLKRDYDRNLAVLKAQPKAAPPGQETAVELRRDAAWRRLERRLDAVPETWSKALAVEALLDQAHEIGDSATIEAAHVELAAYLEHHGEQLLPGRADWLVIEGGSVEGAAATILDQAQAQSIYRAGMAVDHLAAQLGKSDTTHVVIPDVDSKVAHMIPIESDHRPHVAPGKEPPTRVETMATRGDGGPVSEPPPAA